MKKPSPGQAVTVAGGVIAAAVGVAGLVDWVEGRVDPPDPKPPPVIDARVERAALDSPSERLIAFLRDTNQPTDGLSRREGREEGLLFSVRVRLRGNQSKPLELKWRMYGEATGRRVPGAKYAQAAASFTPRNEDHAATVPIWIPHPPRAGTYFVRFTLSDPDRRPIGELRTKPFTLTRVSSA